MRSVSKPIFLVLLVGLVAGCGGGGGGSSLPTFSSPAPLEPEAGTWRTWVVADVDALLPPAPPGASTTQTELQQLRTLAGQRTQAVLDEIAAWDEGTCRRWNALARQLVTSRNVSPPRASRAYALLGVAMHDAMVACFHAKYRWLRARPSDVDGDLAVVGPLVEAPSYTCDRAALSAAAAEVLLYLFPLDVGTILDLLSSALAVDLQAGRCFPSDVTAGETLGATVGQLVVARAQADGADAATIATHTPDGSPYTPAPAPGTASWLPTPAGFAPALLPGWGGVEPWVLATGAVLVLPPAPAYGSAQWLALVTEVHDVSQNLTPERIFSAQFWADGPGTATPPGHWNAIAADAGLQDGWNECRMARLFAILGVAQADAFIACWWNKYFHDLVRPITEIRLRFDPGWLSIVPTPPFPTYPSGHSSTSGAASQVLAYLFPDRAIEFTTMGSDAMNSRLYGGIHYSIDNNGGLDLGRSIANRVLQRVAADE
ncbi:MAG: phosphatase PAP2 family protein [Planctomycetota bacterium]